MSSEKIYQMLWDCQFCGTKKNLGLTHRFCPNCGAPQDPDSRYYPSDEEKVAVEDHVYVGIDVTCANCNELNSAAAEYCGQCGAPLTDAARAKTLDSQSRAAGESFASSGSRDVVKEEFDAEMQRIGVAPAKTKVKRDSASSNNWTAIAVAVVVVLLAAGGFWLFSQTSETTIRVTGLEWERTINLQEYQPFVEGSWRDSPPSGDNVSMRFGSCESRQRSTRRIPDGETCRTVRTDLGDGTYSESQQCTTNYREEPVYDDWCTFTGFRWTNVSPLMVNQTNSLSPYWPEPRLDCEGQSREGCDRISSRNEQYIVVFDATEDDNTYRCEFPQNEWEAVEIGSAWRAEVRQFMRGSILCDTLELQR